MQHLQRFQTKLNNSFFSRKEFLDKGYPFVSMDETSFGRNGRLTRGYSPVGQPLVIRKAVPRITTVSVLALALTAALT